MQLLMKLFGGVFPSDGGGDIEREGDGGVGDLSDGGVAGGESGISLEFDRYERLPTGALGVPVLFFRGRT